MQLSEDDFMKIDSGLHLLRLTIYDRMKWDKSFTDEDYAKNLDKLSDLIFRFNEEHIRQNKLLGENNETKQK